MNPNDLRLPASLESALQLVKTSVVTVGEHVGQALAAQASAATRIAERDLLISASLELRRQSALFQSTFDDTLYAAVAKEALPATRDNNFHKTGSDWQSLSLVDDDQVEEQVFANRIGQQIAHACEIELRELAAYMGTVLNTGRADENRNPLRPDNIGQALYRAVSALTNDRELRKILSRELSRSMAEAMGACYQAVCDDLKAQGVKAVSFSVKTVEGRGTGTSDGPHSTQDRLAHDDPSSTHSGHHSFHPSTHGAPGEASGWSPGGHAQDAAFGAAGDGGQADGQLMSLLRRLTYLASQHMPFDGHSGEHSSAHGDSTGGLQAPSSSQGPSHPGGSTDLMAVNLIRTHREDLVQAASGKLDYMVIDVVGSLFDQILSDPKVPPQMARQIARLQLPVLRVALNDNSFFSSRKHPVRRFVNRIGSLACAFDDFESGPGEQLLVRVRELVQEIVDGDFDQVELYSLKLTELESFIAHSPHEGADSVSHPAQLLASKETELRIQQRYMLQLQAALKPIDVPAYLRDFLAQVWSQALVLAYRRAGPNAELTQQMRRTGRDVVMSVQPKGSPALRKKFLLQLPGLMKDLKEGMRLIGWPEPAHDAFFADLLPSHAESLKRLPRSELDQNLLTHEVEAIFNAPLPGAEGIGMGHGEPLLPLPADEVERRFTPEEAKSVGLVDESQVDWAGEIDIDLTEDAPVSEHMSPAQAALLPGEAAPALDLDLDGPGGGVDLHLDFGPSEPPEPSRGADLINHIQLGFAYQMHLKDSWKKVRLNFVSPGRAFFVFTHGHMHQNTISLSARMLSRMCESGRLKAVEAAYLLERATARAREQLAALRSSAKH